jgi:hypothetical protein
MTRTPDYFPGQREEEALLILSGSDAPAKNGEITYVTSQGFKFYEEGTVKTLGGGSGITAADHKILRQLIHFIDDGPAVGFASGLYKETLPVASPFPTLEIWWESADKLKKIVQYEITRSAGQLPITESWKAFDTDGITVAETATDVITYSGIFETVRSRSLA